MQKINLNVKKTEYEWNISFDNFFLKATPLWFDWIKWTFILGGLSYIGDITNNYIVKIASVMSYLLIFFYLQGFFNSIDIIGFPFIKSRRCERIVSITISAIISALLFLFLSNLALKLHSKV